MKKGCLKANKLHLRAHFKKVRSSLSPEYRQAASLQLLDLLHLKGMIASFASFGDEIDLWPLNQELAKQGRLLLPKVIGQELILCAVTNLQTDLEKSRWGILEPKTAPYRGKIDAILVPGLAFDETGYRLGYGKGHYDRFLSQHHCEKIGIGFKEQLTSFLPIEAHDEKLSNLQLA